jgi:hypothetical protein
MTLINVPDENVVFQTLTATNIRRTKHYEMLWLRRLYRMDITPASHYYKDEIKAVIEWFKTYYKPNKAYYEKYAEYAKKNNWIFEHHDLHKRFDKEQVLDETHWITKMNERLEATAPHPVKPRDTAINEQGMYDPKEGKWIRRMVKRFPF